MSPALNCSGPGPTRSPTHPGLLAAFGHRHDVERRPVDRLTCEGGSRRRRRPQRLSADSNEKQRRPQTAPLRGLRREAVRRRHVAGDAGGGDTPARPSLRVRASQSKVRASDEPPGTPAAAHTQLNLGSGADVAVTRGGARRRPSSTGRPQGEQADARSQSARAAPCGRALSSRSAASSSPPPARLEQRLRPRARRHEDLQHVGVRPVGVPGAAARGRGRRLQQGCAARTRSARSAFGTSAGCARRWKFHLQRRPEGSPLAARASASVRKPTDDRRKRHALRLDASADERALGCVRQAHASVMCDGDGPHDPHKVPYLRADAASSVAGGCPSIERRQSPSTTIEPSSGQGCRRRAAAGA